MWNKNTAYIYLEAYPQTSSANSFIDNAYVLIWTFLTYHTYDIEYWTKCIQKKGRNCHKCTCTETPEGISFQISLWLYLMLSTKHSQEYHYVDVSALYDVRVRIHVCINFLSDFSQLCTDFIQIIHVVVFLKSSWECSFASSGPYLYLVWKYSTYIS